MLECCSADTLLRLEQSSPVSPSRRHHSLSHPRCSTSNKTPQARRPERQTRLRSPLTRCHQISGNVSASSPTLYLPNNSHGVSTNNQNPGAINILYVLVPYRPKNAVSHIRPQLLREAEAHRLEEVASRLRNQRMEAAERKKEREVKLTDKLPPTRRARTACMRYLLLVLHD